MVKKRVPKHNTEFKKEKHRRPRLLWATAFCLLDTSSGASISVRQMLSQLVFNGFEVEVLGATIFDSEKGQTRLPDNWRAMTGKDELILVNDYPLEHKLLITEHASRFRMTAKEEDLWYALYVKALDTFKPDLVWFYGGLTLDLLISDEARQRCIPCAAYLANSTYMGLRWCRDVDLVITNSQANADFYKRKAGITSFPVGIFIDPETVRPLEYTRQNLLFINPSVEKGAVLVIQLAMLLEKKRPDIQLEVLESRGNWQELVKEVTAHYGCQREELDNVLVTPNTNDMCPVYARARVLLVPSLWWESAGRVVAEAMLNAIPAIVTDRGGLPEMLGNGGFKFNLPEVFYEKPYNKFPKNEFLEPIVDLIIKLYDDDVFYSDYVSRARHAGETFHRLDNCTRKLMDAFRPFVEQLAGDNIDRFDPERSNKHGLNKFIGML